MINYELAKKLDENGFPCPKDVVLDSYCFAYLRYREHIIQLFPGYSYVKERLIYAPNLSELIDACGDRFHAIEQKIFKGLEIEGGKWIAYSNENNEVGIKAHIFQQGETLEIAVANLWLALNKK